VAAALIASWNFLLGHVDVQVEIELQGN